ncbi:MAG: DNA topology modulation protein [Phreatobacter sp.]|uniref:DNA topology modulation protein n=1 Tax=Phreatobacter sp. TaxID=1966341 RepID=UPI001A536D98|nr:DNA topology modulation protein [Phreatobacter sp.]MBL8569606.1 DNA topology modulation protein [Phreatobacter sp.]
MQRVLVMGCSGSGKSTFAMALAHKLGLPFVSLDALFWKPGWVEPDKTEFAAKMAEEAGKPSWVMDGNYKGHAGELRRERADAVFWFDLPRGVCLTGALKRVVRSYGRVRPEMAAGCPEQLDFGFLRWIWDYRAKRRAGDVAFLSGLRPDQRLVTFTARRQADLFLAGVGA